MSNRVNIKDYLFFQEGPGVRNYQYTTSGVKLLNVANLQDGKLDISTSSRFISEEEAYGKYKHFLVQPGDLIIASSGIQVDYFDKKMGFANESDLPLCMNTSTIRFQSLDKDKLDIKYFMYFLKSNDFKIQLFRQITGSAQLNFGPSHLKKMTFKLIDLKEQKQIVNNLDKINEAIDIQKDTLKKYDELLKAKFIELFGDPINNTKEYDYKKIDEVCTIVTGTTPDTKNLDYWNGPINWVTPAELTEETVYIGKTARNITASGMKKSGLKIMPIGTVLFSTRAPIGKTAITTEEMTCNQGFKNCICGPAINNKYLYFLLKTFKEYFNSIGTGATFRELSKKTFSNVKISVPPLELQKKFSDYFDMICRHKEIINVDIKNLNKLLETKMDEYFR